MKESRLTTGKRIVFKSEAVKRNNVYRWYDTTYEAA